MKTKRDVGDRQGIIGCSQIGAALGVSTYQSPFDVWCAFTGRERTFTPEEQEILDMGHELEGFIADQIVRIYSKKLATDLKLRRVNGAYVHPDHDWFICHPDRELVGRYKGKKIGIEIKSSSAYDSGRWGKEDTDEIPYDYMCQCYGYMMCHDYDDVWLFRYSNNRLTRYIIPRNEDMQDKILAQLVQFHDKIISGWVPTIEDIETAKREYSRDTSGDIEADEEIARVCREWQERKAEAKEIEETMDVLKARIISYMRDKQVLISRKGEVLAKYIKVTQERLDAKALKAECPDIAERYTKTSSYMKLV